MNKFIKVNCKNCGKIFIKDKGHYNENLKIEHNFYCSRKCESEYKTRKRRILKCTNCGKKLKRVFSAVSPHNYCSRSCAAIINNKNRPERGAKTIKCANCGKKFKKWVVGNKKYCSKSCLINAKFYTTEKLSEIIKNTAQKLGRAPSRREVGSIDKSCRKFFGSWNKAIAAAGLKPNRSHENRMYKRITTKAADGHLCDSISELLIDNWFIKNKIMHERNASYPDTNHKTDWSINFRGENIFIEYFGLAKDSPRYDRSILNKKTLCSKHKIKLIEIYPWDLYPEINLDDKLKIFLG